MTIHTWKYAFKNIFLRSKLLKFQIKSENPGNLETCWILFELRQS